MLTKKYIIKSIFSYFEKKQILGCYMYGLLCDDEWQLWHVGTGDVHAYVNSCGCARWCIVVPVDVQVST
jgi:hypothetical protein